jgi:membrane associated rhomboid family serine protease
MADETVEAQRPGQPAAGAAVAEFKNFLRTVTPRLWLVPGIIGINVAVFALMVAGGVDAFAPGAEPVLRWGANFGPKTLGGEPWRLLASIFLHFGAIHLLMNMVALADAGRMVERIFGHVRFATIYLTAGLCGSAASLLVHPQVVSAGASGAVFGVYGALGGFLLRERGAIPRPVLSRLSRVALGFIGYNMLYGFTQPNIDVAAHIGGVLSGAVAGAYLSRPLAPGRRDPLRKVAVVAAACASTLVLLYVLVPPLARVRLSTHELPGFSIDLPAGEIVEESAEYQVGKLMLKNNTGARSAVAVSWQAGAASRAELEIIAKAVASTLGLSGTRTFTTVPGPGGVGVETVAMDSDRTNMRASVLPCGQRFIMLATFSKFGIDDLHRRMLQTIACHPDPRLEETGIGVVPVKVDLPGWSAIDRTGGQVTLSDGRSILILRSAIVSPTAQLAEVVRAVFDALGAQLVVTATGPDAATLTGTLEGDHVDGWARSVRCPTGGIPLLLAAPDQDTAERIRALTASARCTAPGEAPSSWPDAPRPVTR